MPDAGNAPDAPPHLERGRELTAHESSNSAWAALLTLCASQLMVILDGSIVAVALPAIGRDLDAAGTSLAWVVNAYLVPFGALLLLAGRLGDLLGSRRILVAGLALFTVASLLCGVASTLPLLAAARFVQGVGGALASAVVLGMIVTLFSDEAARARALGVFAFVGAAGSSIGLLAGGAITQASSWPWIFLVNVPLGAAAIVAVIRFVPGSTASRGRADLVGAVLVTLGLMLAVYILLSDGSGVMGKTDHGYALAVAVVAVLLVAFLVRQSRAASPLLPLRLLLGRETGLGNLVQVLMIAGLFGYQVLGVLYLQQVLGFDALDSGLAYLPVPLLIAGVSLGLTAKLVGRFGAGVVLVTGLVVIAGGLGWLTQLPAADGYRTVMLPSGVAIAIGFGLAAPALAGIAVGSAGPADAGVASGLFNTAQQVGGALGLALLTRVATEDTGRLTLPGFHSAFATAALVTVAAAAVACLLVRSRPARGT